MDGIEHHRIGPWGHDRERAQLLDSRGCCGLAAVSGFENLDLTVLDGDRDDAGVVPIWSAQGF